MPGDLFRRQAEKPGGVVVKNIPLLFFCEKVRPLDRFDSHADRIRPSHLVRPKHDPFLKTVPDELLEIGEESLARP